MQPSDTGSYTCEVFSPQGDAGQSQKSVIVSVLGKCLASLSLYCLFLSVLWNTEFTAQNTQGRREKQAVVNKARDAEGSSLSHCCSFQGLRRQVEPGCPLASSHSWPASTPQLPVPQLQISELKAHSSLPSFIPFFILENKVILVLVKMKQHFSWEGQLLTETITCQPQQSPKLL